MHGDDAVDHEDRTALVFLCVVGLSLVATAQGQEFARVLRNGDQATLSVFGPRPVDLAAKKLVDEFGVAINVEDPFYFYDEDVQFSHYAAAGKRVMVPRAALLELSFALDEDGSVAARDEPARTALLRLLRSEPGRARLVRNEAAGAFRLVRADPEREHWYWLMRCQPGDRSCFINVAPIPEERLRTPR